MKLVNQPMNEWEGLTPDLRPDSSQERGVATEEGKSELEWVGRGSF